MPEAECEALSEREPISSGEIKLAFNYIRKAERDILRRKVGDDSAGYNKM